MLPYVILRRRALRGEYYHPSISISHMAEQRHRMPSNLLKVTVRKWQSQELNWAAWILKLF
jgi:hypothetical protein